MTESWNLLSDSSAETAKLVEEENGLLILWCRT
jgi:hypothetical protein